LGIDASESRTWIVSGKTRWLAILTRVFTAVAAAVSVTRLVAFVPILLILGAIAQRRFPRTGFALMVLSATSLSSWVVPITVGLLIQSVRTLPIYHDFNIVAVTSLYVVSSLLVICCDKALIIDFLKLTRLRRGTS
jgi:hypothetical protein